jgi:Sigma-70 region 2
MPPTRSCSQRLRPTHMPSASCTNATPSASTASSSDAHAIHEAALDLTAETFAQAWLSRARFEDLADGSAAPWLYAIARHMLVSSVRRNQLERTARKRIGVLAELDRPQVVSETERDLAGGPGRSAPRAEPSRAGCRAPARRRRTELRRGRPRCGNDARHRARACPPGARRVAATIVESEGGNEMNPVARELNTLGNALELAARRDLARASRSAARRRKLVAVAVGLAIAVPTPPRR